MICISATDELLDWAEHYARNQDVHAKRILSIEKKDSALVSIHSDKRDYFFVKHVLDNLHDFIAKSGIESNDKDKFIIVVLNSRSNVDELLKAWDIASKYPKLSILFVNPKSATEKKWIIKPYIHNRISDKASLSRGILAMAQAVEFC